MTKQFTPPYLGAAYYPELWDEANVDKDIEQMKEAGCNIMRVAEFAWHRMESSEGVFDFAWLRRVVDKLYEAGIATVIGTPTATPPKWLTDRYEETLLMSDKGLRMQHGSRRHTCPNSPVVRHFNRIIVTKLTEEFGHHPGVVGWQIDNEVHPLGHPLGGCFCPICRRGFQTWLEKKYGDIQTLNQKWGNERFSLWYESFYDVIPPRLDFWNHPTLAYAYMEFMSDSYTEFIHEQADILKGLVDAPVGTDMMPILGLDYYDVNLKMDVVQFNHYNSVDNLHHIPMWFDFIRPIKPVPFWNTETQIAWAGGASVAPCPPPDYYYVNSWLPIAYGGEANLYWLWKAHRNGQELMFGSVVSTDGRFNYTVEQVKRLSKEFRKASVFLRDTKVKNTIAMHFTETAYEQLATVPVASGFDYVDRILKDFYLPITQTRHLSMDLIGAPKELDGYDILFSPFLSTLEENSLRGRIEAWVRAGGTWIVGPLSDMFDIHLTKYLHAPFGSMEEWGGVYRKYELPAADDTALVFADGTPAVAKLHTDGFEMRGAESLAAYTEGPLKGLSAITQKQMGKGCIILMGCVLGDQDLMKLLDIVGIPRGMEASDNVVTVRRTGESMHGLMLLELKQKAGYAVLDGAYDDVITGEVVEGRLYIQPYQVRLLRKK